MSIRQSEQDDIADEIARIIQMHNKPLTREVREAMRNEILKIAARRVDEWLVRHAH